MQRRGGNGITFNGTLTDCDVCTVGKSRQLVHLKNVNNTDIKTPFQLVHRDLMGLFTLVANRGCKYVSTITDQFSKFDRRLLALQQELRFCFASKQCHLNANPLQQSNRPVGADKGSEHANKSCQTDCFKTGKDPFND